VCHILDVSILIDLNSRSINTVVEYQFGLRINHSYLAIRIEVIPCCREIHRLHEIQGEEEQTFITVLAD